MSISKISYFYKKLIPSVSLYSSYLSQGSKVSCKRFSTTQLRVAKAELVKVSFVKPDGTKETVDAKVGDSLLDVVTENNVDIDGFGACEGTLACSTCHLILSEVDYNKLPNKPSDEELDMLDLAFDLTDTSRLGCQIIVSKDLAGIEVTVPKTVMDARDV